MEGLEHRRLLDAKVPLRLEGAGIFARIGGQPTVDRMVDALYDRFEDDPVLRPLFGSDLSNERANQKRFFAEWMGAGDAYSQSAYGSLKQRHDRLPITRQLAGRWLGHLRRALAATVPLDKYREVIFSHAQVMAFALVNEDDAHGHRTKRELLRAFQPERAAELARKGDLAGLRTLSRHSPETFRRDSQAALILHAATMAGRAEVVAWLLETGVDANKPHYLPINLAGAAFERVLFVTPLCAARFKRRAQVEAILIEHGAKEDPFSAAFLGDTDRLEAELATHTEWAQASDPATDVLQITPLHHAVAGNQAAALRTILSRAPGPVRGSLRALRGAAALGSLEMVSLLLDRGAQAEGLGPGRWVMDPRIAPLLARAGASVRGPLNHWVRASCTGNQGRKDDPDFVRALLAYGARASDRYAGATPLHYATKAGFVATMKVLLEQGADANAFDDDGLTATDWVERAAKTVAREPVRRLLLSHATPGTTRSKRRAANRG